MVFYSSSYFHNCAKWLVRLCLVAGNRFPENTYFPEMLISGKGKCFHVFGCISKNFPENIFWCLEKKKENTNPEKIINDRDLAGAISRSTATARSRDRRFARSRRRSRSRSKARSQSTARSREGEIAPSIAIFAASDWSSRDRRRLDRKSVV